MSKLRTYFAVALPLSVLVAMAACASSKTSDTGGDDTMGTSDSGGGLAQTPDATLVTMPMTDGSPGGHMMAGEAGSGVECSKGSDCASKLCAPNGTCDAPACNDGVQNGSETDIDCGGSCSACSPMKMCGGNADCTSGVCTGGICQAPNDMDGVKNGNETGIDCGGMGNPQCAAGQGCASPDDCSSDVCTGNVCIAAVCNDKVQNNGETDVDCGGSNCPRCADGEKCVANADCKDSVCKDIGDGKGLRCQPATYTDGVKNGTETDVDCGGSGDPTKNACPNGEGCNAISDCQSDACDYKHTCTPHRSCTGEIKTTTLTDGGISFSGTGYGADNCGRGGDGGRGDPTYESCCATVDVTVTENTGAKPQVVHLDKYKVTAGRMRAFLEAVEPDSADTIDGGVRGFIQAQRAAGLIPNVVAVHTGVTATTSLMPAAWDKYLPVSLAGDPNETPDCEQSDYLQADGGCNMKQSPVYTSAANHVGPTIFKANSQTEQGCFYDAPGTHTYYLAPYKTYAGQPDDAQYSQPFYDEKPLQCVDYLVAQAFCIWDGGRLETAEEWTAAWGPGTMPWSSSKEITSNGVPLSASPAPKTDLPANNPNSQPCTNDPGTPDLDPVGLQYCASQTAAACTYANPKAGGARLKCDTAANGGVAENCVCNPQPTYEKCQFPYTNDLLVQTSGDCAGTPWVRPDAGLSIEVADYQYNYQYPAIMYNASGGQLDFAGYIAAPGRHIGRGPSWTAADGGVFEGAADILGDTFDVTSDLQDYRDDPFPETFAKGAPADPVEPTVQWTGNGSWEVHNYQPKKVANGAYRILDKYGKMGLRCVHTN